MSKVADKKQDMHGFTGEEKQIARWDGNPMHVQDCSASQEQTQVKEYNG